MRRRCGQFIPARHDRRRLLRAAAIQLREQLILLGLLGISALALGIGLGGSGIR